MANVHATMAGNMWKILVDVGDEIEEGQDVAILESMKMEIPISSEQSGTIVKLNVKEGEFVNEGDVIAEME